MLHACSSLANAAEFILDWLAFVLPQEGARDTCAIRSAAHLGVMENEIYCSWIGGWLVGY